MKITDEQAAEIREVYLVPKYARPTMAELARKYGVCSACISDIITFQSHKTTSAEAREYAEKLRILNKVPKTMSKRKMKQYGYKRHLMKQPRVGCHAARSFCGVYKGLWNLIYPKEGFAAYVESVDVCKRCKKFYVEQK